MKKILFLSIALIMALGAFVAPQSAAAGGQELVLVGADETLDGPFYVNAGAQVEIAGTANGDVVVAGGNVNITGSVAGDVIAAGGNVTISGPVAGNVRVAGGQVTIRSTVEKNVSVFGGTVIMSNDSVVRGGLLGAGGMAELRGSVEQKVTFAGGVAILAGNFGSDVDLRVGDDSGGEALVVYPTARVAGNLTYQSPQQVDIADEVVAGEVVYTEWTKAPTHKPNVGGAIFGAYVIKILFQIFALLLIALVITLFVPKTLESVREYAYADSGKRMLLGLAWVVITPIAAFLLMFTVIGIPLAFITLILYFVGLYIVKVFAAYIIGQFVLKKLKVKKVSVFWTTALGIVLYVVLGSIPLLGWIFCFVMTIWALGAVFAFKEHEMARYK